MSLLTCLIGLLQMTLVMLVAGLIARRIRPRSPSASASVGLLGLLAGVCLLLLTVLDVPRPIETPIDLTRSENASQTASADATTIGARPPTSVAAANQQAPFAISLRDALGWLEWQPNTIASNQRAFTAPSIAWLVWIPAIIASIPIAIGFLSTIRLDRSSHDVSDTDAEMFRSFALPSQRHSIRFRESEIVAAPCLTLFGGSTIYLPTGFVDWSAQEQSAAIAHESAHLLRYDPLQRLIAQLITALMILHPLARWLYQGVILSQEMAADRDAALAQGGSFVSSLSRMALRIDSLGTEASDGLIENRWFMRPGVVSVSSSHLIRRIEMLTDLPTGRISTLRRLTSYLTVVGICVACASWSLKADPPSEPAQVGNSTPTEQVARLPDLDQKAATQVFEAPAVEPWNMIRPNHTGYAALRAEELLRHPLFGPMIPVFAEEALEFGWRTIATEQAAGNRTDIGLSTANVDQIVASLNMEISKKEAADGEGSDAKSSLMFGSDGGVLQFKRPVSHDSIESSIDWTRVVHLLREGGIKEDDLGDKTLEEFVDDFRVSAFLDGETSHELTLMPPEKECNEEQLHRLQRAWSAVDGGVATLVWTLADTLGYVENEEDELSDRIFANAACMGVGLDFDKGLEPSHFRVAFIPRDDADLEVIEQSLRRLVAMGQQLLDAEDFEGSEQEAEEFGEILSSIQIGSEHSGDDGSEYLLMTFRVPLASLRLLGSL